MLIGDLARRTGASPRSLRHYERVGLLHPRRTANGYRSYDEAAVEQVHHIRDLLASGFTTNDIAALGGCLGQPPEPGCEPALAMYHAKIDEVEARIDRLRELRDHLARRASEIRADMDRRRQQE